MSEYNSQIKVETFKHWLPFPCQPVLASQIQEKLKFNNGLLKNNKWMN